MTVSNESVYKLACELVRKFEKRPASPKKLCEAYIQQQGDRSCNLLSANAIFDQRCESLTESKQSSRVNQLMKIYEILLDPSYTTSFDKTQEVWGSKYYGENLLLDYALIEKLKQSNDETNENNQAIFKWCDRNLGFWKKLAPDIIQQILLVLVSLAGDETSSESCNENQSFLPFIFSEGKSGETGVISRRNGCSIPFDSDRGSFSYFFMKPQLFMSPDLIQPAYFPQQQQQRQLSRRITDISFNTSVKEYVPVSSSHTAHDNKNSNTTLLIAKQRGLSASKDMDYSGSIVPQKPMDKPSLIQDALFAMLDTASLTFPRNPSTGYLCLRPRKHWIPGAPKALLMRFVKAARLVNELKTFVNASQQLGKHDNVPSVLVAVASTVTSFLQCFADAVHCEFTKVPSTLLWQSTSPNIASPFSTHSRLISSALIRINVNLRRILQQLAFFHQSVTALPLSAAVKAGHFQENSDTYSLGLASIPKSLIMLRKYCTQTTRADLTMLASALFQRAMNSVLVPLCIFAYTGSYTNSLAQLGIHLNRNVLHSRSNKFRDVVVYEQDEFVSDLFGKGAHHAITSARALIFLQHCAPYFFLSRLSGNPPIMSYTSHPKNIARLKRESNLFLEKLQSELDIETARSREMLLRKNQQKALLRLAKIRVMRQHVQAAEDSFRKHMDERMERKRALRVESEQDRQAHGQAVAAEQFRDTQREEERLRYLEQRAKRVADSERELRQKYADAMTSVIKQQRRLEWRLKRIQHREQLRSLLTSSDFTHNVFFPDKDTESHPTASLQSQDKIVPTHERYAHVQNTNEEQPAQEVSEGIAADDDDDDDDEKYSEGPNRFQLDEEEDKTRIRETQLAGQQEMYEPSFTIPHSEAVIESVSADYLSHLHETPQRRQWARHDLSKHERRSALNALEEMPTNMEVSSSNNQDSSTNIIEKDLETVHSAIFPIGTEIYSGKANFDQDRDQHDNVKSASAVLQSKEQTDTSIASDDFLHDIHKKHDFLCDRDNTNSIPKVSDLESQDDIPYGTMFSQEGRSSSQSSHNKSLININNIMNIRQKTKNSTNSQFGDETLFSEGFSKSFGMLTEYIRSDPARGLPFTFHTSQNFQQQANFSLVDSVLVHKNSTVLSAWLPHAHLSFFSDIDMDVLRQCDYPNTRSKRVRTTSASSIQIDPEAIFNRHMFESAVINPIEKHANLVADCVYRYLTHELRLFEHMSTLGQCILLAHGGFSAAIIRLCVDAYGSKGPHRLASVSVLQRAFSDGFSENEHLPFLDCVVLRPRRIREDDDLFVVDSLLRYGVEWPINVFLSSHVLSVYERAGAFLLEISCVKSIFEQLWQSMKALWIKTTLTNEFKNLRHLELQRHEIQHFFSAFHAYLLHQVTQVIWLPFIQDLSTHTRSLDDVIHSINKNARQLEKQVFLHDGAHPVMTAFRKALAVALQFRNELIRAHAATDLVFRNATKHFNSFCACSKLLTAVLRKLAKRIDDVNLEYLLLRLDFREMGAAK